MYEIVADVEDRDWSKRGDVETKRKQSLSEPSGTSSARVAPTSKKEEEKRMAHRYRNSAAHPIFEIDQPRSEHTLLRKVRTITPQNGTSELGFGARRKLEKTQ